MTVAGAVVIALTAAALVYVRSYNRLVHDRQSVEDSWEAVAAELDRRRDLVPPLVEAVSATAVHERRLVDQLIRTAQLAAVTDRSATARSRPEHDLAIAVRAVLALRARYPVLDGRQDFLRLLRELALTDDRISAARHHYNDRVTAFNRRVQALPSSLVARRHGFTEAEFFDE